MLTEISRYILYFLVYSVVGYILEIIICSIIEKKLVNRGFLFGPWLPIYGFGVLLTLTATNYVKSNFALTFLVAIAVCSTLEYITSWALEKIFHIKWWDYSKSEKYNLNGRICLRNCLAFGIAGCIIVYQIHPYVISIFEIIPPETEMVLAIITIIVFVLDTIASVYAVLKAKGMIDIEKIVGDQTNEIKKAARHAIRELFRRKKKIEKKIEKRIKRYKKEVHKKI